MCTIKKRKCKNCKNLMPKCIIDDNNFFIKI